MPRSAAATAWCAAKSHDMRDRIAAMVNVDIAALGDMLAFGPTSHEGNDEAYRGFETKCACLLQKNVV
jgi:hypothetical protein